MTGMPGYADVVKRSADRPPFANSAEAEAWMSGWCMRECVRDAQMGSGPMGVICPLLDVAILENRTPAEWVEPTSALGPEAYRCTKYETGR